jgi:hypothetical protein
MYAVTATVTTLTDGWTSTRQVPTFYLDENVQGIVSEDHAARVAADIIGDRGEVHICAVKLGA